MKNIIVELKRWRNRDRDDNRSEKKRVRERMRMRYTEIHGINFFLKFNFSINFFFDFSSKLHFFFLSILFPFSFFLFHSLFLRFRENYDSYGVDENNGGGGDR